MSTDTETIYSEQGYETIQITDQVQFSDSEEEEPNQNYHDLEYEVESNEEEERPPQVRIHWPLGLAM